MQSSEIRNKFLKYFESHGHKILPGSSLIPKDPTVLLTLAGMLQFKPIFLGTEEIGYRRVATVQKCVRTNDIENVGHTSRHHTFFEMLGNFSFGDYFKKDAIAFAWELITKKFHVDKKKLYVAIYEKDDESGDIWTKGMGVAASHMAMLGEDNNFWAAGPSGPCGPCSEIYYDLGEEFGCGSQNCGPGCDCGRFLEIWNLVFMEFNRDEKGLLSSLPKKNIDTGMGLERIASVLQGVTSNFETDLFVPIMDEIKNLLPSKDKLNTASLRIISDHVRAMTYLISDGLTPGNEGRNYVLRRIMRRAILHGKKLGINKAFLHNLSIKVIELGGDFYPDLSSGMEHISKTILMEEENFGKTLEQGVVLLDDILSKSSSDVMSGDDIFRLYDTYGFPFELTKEIAHERGFGVDLAGFDAAMEKQRQRSRGTKFCASTAIPQIKEYPATEFMGYETLEIQAKVLGVVDNFIILDRTPFYVESGGQDSDRGWLVVEKNTMPLLRLAKTADGVVLHQIEEGILPSIGEKIKAEVNRQTRSEVAAHHTATHLLHAALRKILGGHVKQTGSFVGSDKFRLDFSHYEAVKDDDLMKIEEMVKEIIQKSLPVQLIITDIDNAKSLGAMALFDAKYGEKVRVVKIGDFSLELCGGTHVKNTSDIGFFKIIRESAISQGLRRIEAVSGDLALNYLKNQEEEIKRIEQSLIEKERGREEEKFQEQEAISKSDALIKSALDINGVKVITAEFKEYKSRVLKVLHDVIASKLKSCISILVSVFDDKISIIVGITDDLVKKGFHAGKIIKELAALVGGRGGGKADLAEAGAKISITSDNRHIIQDIFKKAVEIIKNNQ